MKYFLLVFLILFASAVEIDMSFASEPRMIDENKIMGNAHPDSCTRWQQWDFGICVDKTDYPAHLDAFHFMQLVTIPFLGGAGIFVVASATPRISKRKRIAVMIPCSALLLLSSLIIFFGGFFYF